MLLWPHPAVTHTATPPCLLPVLPWISLPPSSAHCSLEATLPSKCPTTSHLLTGPQKERNPQLSPWKCPVTCPHSGNQGDKRDNLSSASCHTVEGTVFLHRWARFKRAWQQQTASWQATCFPVAANSIPGGTWWIQRGSCCMRQHLKLETAPGHPSVSFEAVWVLQSSNPCDLGSRLLGRAILPTCRNARWENPKWQKRQEGLSGDVEREKGKAPIRPVSSMVSQSSRWL